MPVVLEAPDDTVPFACHVYEPGRSGPFREAPGLCGPRMEDGTFWWRLSVLLATAAGNAPWMDGSALADECRGALLTFPPARAAAKLTDGDGLTPEGEALQSLLALAAWRRYAPAGRHGSPAAVLAYIARCERFPVLMAREADAVPRGAVGRRMLHLLLAGILRDDRTWQDVADAHRSRTDVRRGDGPRRAILATTDPDAGTDPLSLAIDRDAAASDARDLLADACPAPADLPDLAADAASALDLTGVAHRRATAAIAQALAHVTGADVVDVLAGMARDQGRTLNAVRLDASRAVLPVAPADLLTALAAALAARPRPGAVWDRVDARSLARKPADAPWAVAAGEAVRAVTRGMGAWDPGSIRSGRSLPSWPERTVPARTTSRPTGQRASVLAYIGAVLDAPDGTTARLARWGHRAAPVHHVNRANVPLNGQPVTGSHGDAAWA